MYCSFAFLLSSPFSISSHTFTKSFTLHFSVSYIRTGFVDFTEIGAEWDIASEGDRSVIHFHLPSLLFADKQDNGRVERNHTHAHSRRFSKGLSQLSAELSGGTPSVSVTVSLFHYHISPATTHLTSFTTPASPPPPLFVPHPLMRELWCLLSEMFFWRSPLG